VAEPSRGSAAPEGPALAGGLHPTLRRPTPRGRHPLVRAARVLWTLPTNGLGHLAGAVASRSLGRRVESPLATARVYLLDGSLGQAIGGVALGHAILLSRRYDLATLRGRVVLAHELAHTRQHDVLGPLYLPLHVGAQLVSSVLFRLRPVPGSTPLHAYNPLEQRFLFFGAGAIAEVLRGERLGREELEAMLESLGI